MLRHELLLSCLVICVQCTDDGSRPQVKRRNTNPFTEGYDPSLVEGEAPPGSQTTADGATVVPAYQSVEPSRAWDNQGGGGAADGPRIPSGEASAFLAPQRRQRRGSDSDADSEATEGCDDVEDIDEGMLTFSVQKNPFLKVKPNEFWGFIGFWVLLGFLVFLFEGDVLDRF